MGGNKRARTTPPSPSGCRVGSTAGGPAGSGSSISRGTGFLDLYLCFGGITTFALLAMVELGGGMTVQGARIEM